MPVTVTGVVNVTSTKIRSPSWYVFALAGELRTAMPPGYGVVNCEPSTLWKPSFATACEPKSRTASTIAPESRIVPPFSVSALAPMLIPFPSLSDCTTV